MTAVNTVAIGDPIVAPTINTLVTTLQVPAGGTEAGRYCSGGNAYASSSILSCSPQTISNVSVAVSVALSGGTSFGPAGAPTAGHITAGGFQVYIASTAIGTNVVASGLWTLQY